MPYDSIQDLPDQVRTNASASCQRVYRRAFNSAEGNDEHTDESTYHQVAWTAVEQVCSQSGGDTDDWTRDRSGSTETESAYAPTRFVARDSLEAADDPTAGPWTFSGVSVAPGDILHMADGTPVLFTDDELRKAARTQAGQQLTDDHPDHDLGSAPPRAATIGEVTAATFVPDKGVVYEARTHDSDVAAGVHGGSYDVSVHPAFTPGPKDPETGAIVAEDIQFTDLSVVSRGDSPSNTAQWGPSQDLAASYQATDFDELLAGNSDSLGLSASTSSTDTSEESAASLWRRFASKVGLSAAEQPAADPAEPGRDSDADADADADAVADANTDSDAPMNRDNFIQTLHEEHDFDESMFEDMSDEHLEHLHETVVGTESNQPDDTPTQNKTGDDGGGDGVKAALSNPFVEYDSFDELVSAKVAAGIAAAETERANTEKIDEIIAYDDDYSEDDREELEASSPGVIDKIHEKATTSKAGPMPGVGGKRSAVEARAGGSEGDGEYSPEDFTTGVQ